jgi:tol-pal system protein YbgF
MRLNLSILILVVLTALLAGCASRGEIETMKRQLNYLERSSTEMQDRIALLDSLYRATLERNVTYQADLKLILADLRDRTTIIDGRLTDIESRMAQVVNRMGGEATLHQPTASAPTDSSGDTTAAGPSGATVDANKMFDNAFADLNKGNYDLAIMQFQEFILRFPDNPMADDAQYWLGECYYGKKDYSKAIPEFEKVEKNYPKSDKLVSALFKMGRSYQELGDTSRAKAIFQRIIKDYPDSFEAKPAQERLQEL